jgi:hypothetical protein
MILVRRHFLLLALLSLLTAGCPRDVVIPVAPGLTDGEERALRVVQTALEISREEGQSIWPGYALHTIPLLVFRPQGRSFVVNPRTISPKRVRVTQGWLTEEVYAVDSRSLRVSSNLPFAKEFPLDGEPVFLVRHLDRTKDSTFFRLLVHEVFHFHQHTHWESVDFPVACRYPYGSAENAYLVRLEEKALAFLLALEEIAALTDPSRTYVALRLARYGSDEDGERALAIEEWEELVEGSARYVEEMYSVAAGYATKRSIAEEMVAYFKSFRPKDLQKWKYYRTGAALAMVLDRLGDSEWKARCAQGIGPFQSLEAAVSPLTDEDGTRVKTWQERFASERPEVAEALADYLHEEEKVLEEWRSQGTHEVTISFPGRGTAYYTNRGMTFQLKDCARLASGIVSFVDRTYGLEIQKRGIAVANIPPGYQVLFHHDLAEGTIRLDGQAIPETIGVWDFRKSISVVFPKFRLSWQGEGRIVRGESVFKLVLEAPQG